MNRTAMTLGLLLLVVSACETPIEPEAPQSSQTHAILKIQVDGGSCSNKVVNVVVFIDGQREGMLQPGGGVVSKTVSIGNHTWAANGDGTYGPVTWSTKTVAVTSAGYALNLTCNGL